MSENNRVSKSASVNKFAETKTGLIGLKRDTMLQSELQFLVSLKFVQLDDQFKTELINFFFFWSLNLERSETVATSSRPRTFRMVSLTKSWTVVFRRLCSTGSTRARMLTLATSATKWCETFWLWTRLLCSMDASILSKTAHTDRWTTFSVRSKSVVVAWTIRATLMLL